MRAYDIIKKKRDGFELSKEELSFIVKGATAKSIPDYQLSAFLMAVFIRGMSEREILDFTVEIAQSGSIIDASGVKGVKVDKHSTGGVGDKTSLIISPVVSALGLKVLKMSGRGLGYTGGTVDKLSSIKGFNTQLNLDRFISICNKTGLSIVGQTENLAPADKIFYALRDVTATVESIPLIASSIMGKKLTASDDVIVLDVKTGDGAFMKTLDLSIQLADVMVKIGKGAGKKISAVITDMNEPLGYTVGNALEVKEAIDVLKGKVKGDLYDVCKHLSAEVMYLSGYGEFEICEKAFDDCISSGKAYKKFNEFIVEQGGSLIEFDNGDYLPQFSQEVYASKSGYITKINAEKVGIASLYLGAGRNSKEDDIDYKAGIILNKKVGDRAEKGDILCTLYASDKSLFEKAKLEFLSAVEIRDEKPIIRNLILKTIR